MTPVVLLLGTVEGWWPPNPSREVVAMRAQYWMEVQVGHEQGPAAVGNGEKIAEGLRVDLRGGAESAGGGGVGKDDEGGVRKELCGADKAGSLKSNTSARKSAGTVEEEELTIPA